MVGHDEDDPAVQRAARLSYHRHPGDEGWDLTAGDSLKPENRDGFRGRAVDTREGVARCPVCHTTNVRLGRKREGPETADRGIGCENCHGPGGNHILAVEAKLSEMAILMPTAQRACASCHDPNESLSEQAAPTRRPSVAPFAVENPELEQMPRKRRRGVVLPLLP
jgi:hypothetical protein